MGGGTHTSTVDSKLVGIAIQTALLGLPIPMGWGRGRLSCNMIDYVGFKATAHTQTTSSGGGKGGGNTSSTTTYTYSASVVLAICEGPITGIVTAYKDASVFSTLGAAGLSLASGTAGQSPWAYLTSAFPSHALNYPNIAYAYAQDYALSGSASLANHSFEVNFAVQLAGASGGDADPKDIITDFLTNAVSGVAGWGAGLIGNLTNYSLYCRSNNLLLSPVIDQQMAGSDFIKQVMAETNSDCFWSEGVLKIKPFGDAAATANSVSFTPDLTPIYDLDEGAFLTEVQLEIVDQSDAYNLVQVEFLDRSNQYQPAIQPADDLDNIITYGLRKQDPQSLHHICDATIARQVAQLWLQRNLYIRDRYHFDLPMDFIALEPMDYVTLSTTVDGMVLNRQLVMIESIDEDEDGQDVLHLVAEGVPGATASAAAYTAHVATGFQPVVEVDPGNVAAPFLFNAPTSLTANGYEVWAAVAGGANWGGCNVWASSDGTHYTQVGAILSPARYGVLGASLATGTDPDSTNTLSVNLSISAGSLGGPGNTVADNGGSMCWVDGELISYGSAALTSAYNYNLTYLRRGQRGSTIGAHLSGTRFARLDDGIFRYAYDPALAGTTFYVKFQSFNIYGRGLQLLSGVTAYTLALSPTGTMPTQVTGLALAAGGSTWTGNSLDLVWTPSLRATSYRADVYKADGTTFIRSITTSTAGASYTASMALRDGVQRSYVVKVYALNSAGSAPASSSLAVSNTPPAAVSSPAAAGGSTVGTITCAASVDPDLSGYIGFYSSASGFDPLTVGGVVTSGTNSLSVFGLAAGTYYCRIAACDPWSADPSLLNLSAEMNFVITTGGGTTPTGGGGGGGGFRSAGYRLNSF